MAFKIADRIKESSTTTGTGTLTLSGALTGYRSFGNDIGDGIVTEYAIVAVDTNGLPTGEWEVGIGTYTASGTTLSRTTVLTNSSGTGLLQDGTAAKISFAAGTKHVSVGVGRGTLLAQNRTCDFRLTLESGVAVSTTEQTAKTTLYLTPYQGNRVALYTSGQWVLYQSAELSLVSPTLTNARNYDVFLYDNAGTLTLELSAAWNSDGVTRTDALATQDGIRCKSGSLNKRLVGTIRASATNQMSDSAGGGTTKLGGKRFVYNEQNRVLRPIMVLDTTDSWDSTDTNYHIADGATAPDNCFEWVSGSDEHSIAAELLTVAATDQNEFFYNGIGLDSSSVNSARCSGQAYSNLGGIVVQSVSARFLKYCGIGYHYLSWLEKVGSGTISFYGDNGGVVQSGLVGQIWC